MTIDELKAYDVPEDVLAIWRETVGPDLLPVQARAVREFGLLGDGNLVVASPTSSGKTFIGEMAAVRAALQNSKVIYLAPQRALVDEKYRELAARYGKVGLKVVVSSRDHREFDDAIQAGNFQIAVIVVEKLQGLLVNKSHLLERVGLIVVDELQLIADEGRGPTLELLLTKVLSTTPTPRLIGLSAVIGRANVLAEWLQARLLIEEKRPVELRRGVLCKGKFTYREQNSRVQGVEEFTDIQSDRPEAILGAALEDLARRRGEQVLVFLPDRSSTVSAAKQYAEQLGLAPAIEAVEELRDHEDTFARERLLNALKGGVAFHNSDLSPAERGVVERHFRSGEIRVLFSTSTLAMGMNLPVKNVIIEPRKWKYYRRSDRWDTADINKADYENMSGRAGRLLASESGFGRSILVTDSTFQVNVWLRFYVDKDFDELVPMLKDAPLENHVLNVVASSPKLSREEIARLLLSSFSGHVFWKASVPEELAASLDKAIRRCVEGGLLVEEEGVLSATGVGRVSAAKGLQARTAIALARWAQDSTGSAISELEYLTLLALTKDAADIHVALPRAERWSANYPAQLLQRVLAEAGERPIFRPYVESRTAPQYVEVRAFKKALLLHDWINEVPTRELEKRYQLWAGTIARVGEEFAWIADGLLGVAKAVGWPMARCSEIERLAVRLGLGVRPDAVAIASLRVPGFGRSMARHLTDAGLRTLEALAAKSCEELKAILKSERSATAVWARLHPSYHPVQKSQAKVAELPLLRAAEAEAPYEGQGETRAPVLVVDLRECQVMYRGIEIRTRPPNNLQRLPLLALAALASRPGQAMTMAEVADWIHKLGVLGKKPVAPDAKDLRYKILQPFKKAMNDSAPKSELDRLVESVRGVGLRLNVSGPVLVLGQGGEDQAA